MFSTILFALNIINIGVMAINDNKPKTMEWASFLTKWIKRVASTILLVEIVFLAVVGEFDKSTNPDSMDAWMIKHYPSFHSKLEYMGFRMQ